MSGSGIRIVYAFFGVNENGNIYVLITEYKDSEVTQPAGCLSPNSFDEFLSCTECLFYCTGCPFDPCRIDFIQKSCTLCTIDCGHSCLHKGKC